MPWFDIRPTPDGTEQCPDCEDCLADAATPGVFWCWKTASKINVVAAGRHPCWTPIPSDVPMARVWPVILDEWTGDQ